MFDQKITIELVARNPLTLKLVGPDGLDPKFTMLAVRGSRARFNQVARTLSWFTG